MTDQKEVFHNKSLRKNLHSDRVRAAKTSNKTCKNEVVMTSLFKNVQLSQQTDKPDKRSMGDLMKMY